MCPMRILLVFFSAALAGFFAWRTYRSASEEGSDGGWGDSVLDEQKSGNEEQELDFGKVLERGFWVFVDMASGRYLWRNLKEMKSFEKSKSC